MSGVKHSALLVKCVEVIESFNPKKTTVDAHVDDSPTLNDKSIGDVQHKFIQQVFYGCTRYKKLLRIFVTSFLYKHPTTARREDQTLYTILSYMLFFRLEELGITEFCRFFTCGLGTTVALSCLLKYILNEEDLNKWVKMEWCKHYDMHHVENEIIGKLQSFKGDLQPLLEDIEFKATGVLQLQNGDSGGEVTEKKVTKFEPFNLTTPKPRLVPEPEVISREVKALPLPKTLQATSLEQLTEEKKDRLEKEKLRVKEKYPATNEFNFETSKRPGIDTEVDLLRDKVESERYKECTFQPILEAGEYHEPAESAEVRQNAASVLREDALVKKKQLQEYRTLKRFEEDLRDASVFYEWQTDMRQRDQLEEELLVQQRKVEMQMARQAAIDARESMVERNHILAEHQKEEVKLGLATQEHEQYEVLQKKVQLVHDVIEERVRPREAEEQLLVANQHRAEIMRREKEADMERKKLEDASEMERKKDLIRQIRAIERISVLRAKLFDPSEPPCQGLMEEMSLAELKERLKMVQAQQAKELEDRRELNLKKKEQKQSELLGRAENLSKIRAQARDEAHDRSEKLQAKKNEEEAQRQKIREQCILDASLKIAQKKKQKREEEARLRRELKEISIKRQFLQANAEMVEAKAHGEQQKGLDREARVRQNDLLLEQMKKNEVKTKEQNIRRENVQKERDEFQAMCKAVDMRLSQAKDDHNLLMKEITTGKLTARTLQRSHEHKLAGEIGWSSNKFSTHRGHGGSQSAR